MQARFCFRQQPYDLFLEAGIHGWYAAIGDYPRLASYHENMPRAQAAAGDLAPQVCCIPADDFPYQLLVVSAWQGFYFTLPYIGERLLAQVVLYVRKAPREEGLAFLRATGNEQRPMLEGIYSSVSAHFASV